MKQLSLFLTVLSACSAATAQQHPPLIDPVRYVEQESISMHPKDEPLPAEIPSGSWARSLEENEGDHPAGILISEEKAFRLRLFQIRYEELRTKKESDDKVISAQRVLYEKTVQNLKTEIDGLQPTWYDRNKSYIWGVVGVVVGGGVVLSVNH